MLAQADRRLADEMSVIGAVEKPPRRVLYSLAMRLRSVRGLLERVRITRVEPSGQAS